MTWFEVLSLIGAASWLPQFAQWLFKTRTKAKLDLLTGNVARIGFHPAGSQIGFTALLAAEKRDAVIKKITLAAKHERGEERHFVWTRLTETFFDLRAIGGEVSTAARTSKTVDALALKVSTLALTEREIVFEDPEFAAKMAEQMRVVKAFHNCPKEKIFNEKGRLSAKELVQALDLFKQEMHWKEGQYRFRVQIEVVGQKQHVQDFNVTVTTQDVEKLRSNFHAFNFYVSNFPKLPELEPANWHWAEPKIQRVK